MLLCFTSKMLKIPDFRLVWLFYRCQKSHYARIIMFLMWGLAVLQNIGQKVTISTFALLRFATRLFDRRAAQLCPLDDWLKLISIFLRALAHFAQRFKSFLTVCCLLCVTSNVRVVWQLDLCAAGNHDILSFQMAILHDDEKFWNVRWTIVDTLWNRYLLRQRKRINFWAWMRWQKNP